MSLLEQLSPDEKTTAAILLVRNAETLPPGPERTKLLQAAEQLLSAPRERSSHRP